MINVRRRPNIKMELEEIKEKVERKINSLINEFRISSDKFLTEEDIRSYLYHLLLEDFNKLEETADGKKSICLHNEIRWLGSRGILRKWKLRFLSDIVIFDVSSLRTKNTNGIEIHSKGYGFGKPYILIELKLRRNKGCSDKKFVKDIIADREKITRIKKEISDNFYSYIIAFDKKKEINFSCKNTGSHKEYYECANQFSSRSPSRFILLH